jgi:hypothetical protein
MPDENQTQQRNGLDRSGQPLTPKPPAARRIHEFSSSKEPDTLRVKPSTSPKNLLDDEDFADSLVALLCTDIEALTKCAPELNVDGADFEPPKGIPSKTGRARQITAQMALNYFDKHQQPIGLALQGEILAYRQKLGLSESKAAEWIAYADKILERKVVGKSSIIENTVWYLRDIREPSDLSHLGDLMEMGQLNSQEGLNTLLHLTALVEGNDPDECTNLAEQPQWPERPSFDSPVFSGIAGEIVQAIDPLTEADPMAVLIQLLAGFGVMVGHGPRMTFPDEQFTNIHVCIVGTTEEGKKGTALKRAKQVLSWIDPAFVAKRCFGGVRSGQAMIEQVCDALFRGVDKNTGEPKIVHEGAEDKRWFMVEEEFGSTLIMCRSENSILSHMIRESFDSGNLRNVAIGTPLCATSAQVGANGHITPKEFTDLLRNTTLHLNGFCNRFAFTCSVKSKEMRRGNIWIVPGAQEFQKRLQKAYPWARKVRHIAWTEGAKDLWEHSVYAEVNRVHGNILDEVANRGNAIVPRIAGIQALLNDSRHSKREDTAVVGRWHLESAIELWRSYCVPSARFIFGSSATLHPEARRVLAVLDECKRISRSDLSLKAFGNNNARLRLDKAASVLQPKGLIRIETDKTATKPCEVWTRVSA